MRRTPGTAAQPWLDHRPTAVVDVGRFGETNARSRRPLGGAVGAGSTGRLCQHSCTRTGSQKGDEQRQMSVTLCDVVACARKFTRRAAVGTRSCKVGPDGRIAKRSDLPCTLSERERCESTRASCGACRQ